MVVTGGFATLKIHSHQPPERQEPRSVAAHIHAASVAASEHVGLVQSSRIPIDDPGSPGSVQRWCWLKHPHILLGPFLTAGVGMRPALSISAQSNQNMKELGVPGWARTSKGAFLSAHRNNKGNNEFDACSGPALQA